MATMVTGQRWATRSARCGSARLNKTSSAGTPQVGAALSAGAGNASAASRNAGASIGRRRARRVSRDCAMLAGPRGGRAGILDRRGNETGEQTADAVMDAFGGVGVLARGVEVEGPRLAPMLHQGE